ncbi:hypothetical protein ACFWYW_28185 [Nonomuraea sp. NPDC059023]|uniref:hypothetical protein n=1 Tax=unclassified Nonomuraea TaxID=2593643 RepID=UPI003681810F
MDTRQECQVWPGPTRKARGLPTAVIALTTVIGLTTLALTGNQAPATASVAAHTAVKTAIPKGFLLYESKAARKRLEKKVVRTRMQWKVSDRLEEPLLIDPCATGKRTDKSRQSARTITGRSVTWDGDYSEQVIVYRDEMAARAAMKGLRSDLRRCAKRNRNHFTYRVKATGIGDEAFMVNMFKVASIDAATVMRQGRTVAIYALPGSGDIPGDPPKWREADYGGLEARKMAKKLNDNPL